MTGQVTAVIAVSAHAPSPPRTGPPNGLSFHAILSALNPLQYLPVVGTIYRAVTGDTIPEAERRIGSLIVSGVMGGPIGIAINLVTTALEKMTGIDLDRTGQALLHGESLGQAVTEQTAAARSPPAAPSVRTDTARAHPAKDHNKTANAWSAAALAAYGVHADDAGTLRMAGLQGADVLNTLELARLRTARAAYARTAALGG